jgi:hypothetical protein
MRDTTGSFFDVFLPTRSITVDCRVDCKRPIRGCSRKESGQAMKIESITKTEDYYHIYRDDGFNCVQRRHVINTPDSWLSGDEEMIIALCDKLSSALTPGESRTWKGEP